MFSKFHTAYQRESEINRHESRLWYIIWFNYFQDQDLVPKNNVQHFSAYLSFTVPTWQYMSKWERGRVQNDKQEYMMTVTRSRTGVREIYGY